MQPKWPIEIVAVGDISLGEHYFLSGCGPRSIAEQKGPDYLFDKIREQLITGDIVFGNLECVLSDYNLDAQDIESVVFRGSPDMVQGLKRAGFNVLNIANNHILQHGPNAFRDTVSHLTAHKIFPLGLRQGGSFSTKPVTFEIRGTRIGILGYSIVSEQYEPNNTLYAASTVENILTDIKRLATEVDVVIVSCHLGMEAMDHPSPYVANLARCFIDNGVRIFLGHHPHVFQKVEEYNEGLICYSLGNFIFDLRWYAPLNWGAVAKIQIWPDRNLTYTLLPFRTNVNFQPLPLIGNESEEYLNRIRKLIAPSQYCDFEKTSYSYYAEVARLERYLFIKRILFFFSHLLKGNFYLKIRFFINKIIKRQGKFTQT